MLIIIKSNDGIPLDKSDWSVDEVVVWLQSLNLGMHAAAFLREEISGEALLQLKLDDLEQLGISKVGHKKKLLMEIYGEDSDRLVSSQTSTASGSSSASATPSIVRPLERQDSHSSHSDLLTSSSVECEDLIVIKASYGTIAQFMNATLFSRRGRALVNEIVEF